VLDEPALCIEGATLNSLIPFSILSNKPFTRFRIPSTHLNGLKPYKHMIRFSRESGAKSTITLFMEEGYEQRTSAIGFSRSILQNYPFSVDMIRELMQNSDDAGVSKGLSRPA
jgi:hypothetical protein